jgi:hypothetical protein
MESINAGTSLAQRFHVDDQLSLILMLCREVNASNMKAVPFQDGKTAAMVNFACN